MLQTETVELTELFVGAPYFSLEHADFREMTEEWIRRQTQESAARMSCSIRQFGNSADLDLQQPH